MRSETMRDEPSCPPFPSKPETATMGNCSPFEAWMVMMRTKLLSFADSAPGGSERFSMRAAKVEATKAASQQRSPSMSSAMRTTFSAFASLAWFAARQPASRRTSSSRRATHPDSCKMSASSCESGTCPMRRRARASTWRAASTRFESLLSPPSTFPAPIFMLVKSAGVRPKNALSSTLKSASLSSRLAIARASATTPFASGILESTEPLATT